MVMAAEGGDGLGCGADWLLEKRRTRARWVWVVGARLSLWRGDLGARVAEDWTPPKAPGVLKKAGSRGEGGSARD